MRLLVAVAPLLVLFALVSCGGNDARPAATATAAPFPGDTWQLEYSVSGGIIGRDERMTLDQTGKFTTEDKRAKRSRDGNYNVPSDISLIAALLRDLDLPNFKKPGPSGCADCIETSVTVASGGKTYEASVTNQAPSQPMTSLLNRLAAIYDANLP